MPRFVEFDLAGRSILIEVDPSETGTSGLGDFGEWWGGVLELATAIVPEKGDDSTSAAIEVELGVGVGPDGQIMLGAPAQTPIRIHIKPPTAMAVDELATQRPKG